MRRPILGHNTVFCPEMQILLTIIHIFCVTSDYGSGYMAVLTPSTTLSSSSCVHQCNPGEEVVGSIPAVATRSLPVGSLSV